MKVQLRLRCTCGRNLADVGLGSARLSDYYHPDRPRLMDDADRPVYVTPRDGVEQSDHRARPESGWQAARTYTWRCPGCSRRPQRNDRWLRERLDEHRADQRVAVLTIE